MINLNCDLLPLARIRPTEEVCPIRVDEVIALITLMQAWTQPICIEATVYALLDGHHRLAAARRLGLARIPVHVFNYADVELASWRPDFAPTRDEVLSRALSGELYPHKTTRHTFVAREMRPILLSDLTYQSRNPSSLLRETPCSEAAVRRSDLYDSPACY